MRIKQIENHINTLKNSKNNKVNQKLINEYEEKLKQLKKSVKTFKGIIYLKEQKKVENHKITSKYKGVLWNERAQKWMAQIGLKNKKKYLGLFLEEEKASQAYQKALIEKNNGKKVHR